ncbi:tRNA uracil 4-sulfurtransferase ThiI [Paludicola sp. MB14-C6]|uniref:tRNA uracil 4-sulfurtransferase ThiI n=1 Tax=Paludihabitans sp. MB14-C6 TaxID=3070656 RepID=UPI0027DB0F77|nr:tRNA uracil 4-sulfurtransferase ThiI [Paludicola sp. MB14-C6]WMJ22124.1 tRNA uracil 4-sulfurtransferase ThiI [Paludicola sp. MB14-C6]
MKEIILVKNGEIALKGLNRHTFEDALVKNIRWRLRKIGKFQIKKAQSTIYITPENEQVDLDEACDALKKVFGIAAFSRSVVTQKDLEVIKTDAIEYLKDLLPYTKTFKVAAKRADKRFPYQSPDLQRELGGALLDAYPHLKVDVHNPEVTVTVEIREESAYVHAKVIQGAGGMPVGTSGEGLLLVSGGIDSPVAGYMMARRGLKMSAMHFISPPYTSDRALQKVETLCEKLSDYSGDIVFYCVPFTKLQEAIRDNCPEELFTIIMRRLMMEIAIRFAERENIPCLVTGESLAQVASQTVYAIATTNAVADRPVFRPLIGMDKNDIIAIARQIDTFETSILPYEDCCTVFTPKRPKTKPTLKYVEESQAAFDFEPLLADAVDNTIIKTIKM